MDYQKQDCQLFISIFLYLIYLKSAKMMEPLAGGSTRAFVIVN